MRMKSIFIFCITLLTSFTLAQVEPSPEEGLRKFLLDKYSKDVQPRHNRTSPVTIYFGLAIISIEDLDETQQTIDVNMWLKLGWKDLRLLWQPEQHANISVLRVGVKQLWIPDIFLYNSAVSQAQTISENALVYPIGDVVWIPENHLSALCQFHLTYYPYDTHNCSLKFGSWVYDASHLDFEFYDNKTEIDLIDYWGSNDWDLVSTYIEKKNTFFNCCDTPYTVVTVYMTLRRHSTAHQAAILFPIAAGVVLAFTAFLCSPFDTKRLFINAFNILLFMLTLLHLQQQLPVVGRSSPAVVLISESMILLLSLAIVWTILTMSFVGRYKNSRPPPMVQWLINSWLMKVLMVSSGDHMQECNKKTLDIGQLNDPEMMSIVTEDKSTVTNGWMTFFSLLDRLAFVTFTIIVLALLLAFTR